MRTMSLRRCEKCGSYFRVRTVTANRGGGRFCSRHCARSVPCPARQIDIRARFWKYVDKNGPVPVHRPELGPCWIWIGSKNRGGYGMISFRGKPKVAHHVAWYLEHDRLPADKALHKCDGGALGCVRHDHLFEGSQADNVADMFAKGRNRNLTGEAHGMAKLTESLVHEARQLHAAGWNFCALGRRYGVTRVAVRFAIRGRSWKHV